MVISGKPQDHAVASNRRGMLALALQEPLTATIRLRTKRQVVADASAFRAHIKRLLATADDEARRAGYEPNDVRLAIYAVTVFVDESVLNSASPAFADWPRQPLQEEIFGGHTGGETFFQNLRELLGRGDSEDLGDLLEVHQLCLLLGLKGRYSQGDPMHIAAITTAVNEKIQRIRGVPGSLAPSGGLLAGEKIPPARDPWLPRLAIVAAGSGLLWLVLFILFRVSLSSSLSDLHNFAAQLIP